MVESSRCRTCEQLETTSLHAKLLCVFLDVSQTFAAFVLVAAGRTHQGVGHEA